MKHRYIILSFLVIVALQSYTSAYAGIPFINAEGVGGCGLNVFAYPAMTPGDEGFKLGPLKIAKPRMGGFYVNLNDSFGGVDWTTMGIATTINKRLEVSFGYENVSIGAAPKNTHKYNVGAKLLLLEENSFGTKFMPAISIGTIYKNTAYPFAGTSDDDGFDVYLVATKFITQLPYPVLLSGGVMSTQGHVNGHLGFDSKRRQTIFLNFDFLPTSWLALGFEYKQGPDYGDYEDADYFDAHAVWFVSDKFALAAAYTYAGERNETKELGLGGAIMLSAQYAF